MKERIGTPYYIAPEVIKNSYGKECDLWSCGVLLYILLSGYPPFNGRNNNQIINAVKTGKYDLKRKSFERVSSKAKNLIKKLLTYDPAQRPNATEALDHPWFKDSGDEEFGELDPEVLSNFRNFNVNFFFIF